MDTLNYASGCRYNSQRSGADKPKNGAIYGAFYFSPIDQKTWLNEILFVYLKVASDSMSPSPPKRSRLL